MMLMFAGFTVCLPKFGVVPGIRQAAAPHCHFQARPGPEPYVGHKDPLYWI